MVRNLRNLQKIPGADSRGLINAKQFAKFFSEKMPV